MSDSDDEPDLLVDDFNEMQAHTSKALKNMLNKKEEFKM